MFEAIFHKHKFRVGLYEYILWCNIAFGSLWRVNGLLLPPEAVLFRGYFSHPQGAITNFRKQHKVHKNVTHPL